MKTPMATIYPPYVIERSSRGERTYDIFSRLLMDRIVFLGTPINDDVAKKRNQDPGQVYASLQKANRLSEIERSITEERVFAWLLERNTVE